MSIKITEKDTFAKQVKDQLESLSKDQLILLVLKLTKETHELKSKLKEYQNILDGDDLK